MFHHLTSSSHEEGMDAFYFFPYLTKLARTSSATLKITESQPRCLVPYLEAQSIQYFAVSM